MKELSESQQWQLDRIREQEIDDYLDQEEEDEYEGPDPDDMDFDRMRDNEL